MQFLIFFLVVFTVFGIGYGYVGWRLISTSSLTQSVKLISWIAVIVMYLLPVTSVLLDRTGNDNISSKLAWITYVSMGLFSFLFLMVLLRDLSMLAVFLFKKAGALFAPAVNASLDAPPDPGRRNMIMQTVNLGILGIAAGLTTYGVYQARRRPAVKEFEVPVKDLPGSLENFRIVQITDMHVGLTVRRDYVETVVEMVNSLKPDIIAFTGDMVDGSVQALRSDVEPFSNLKAKYGKYFVTGNHEYYSGADEWIAEVKKLGMKVLMNESEAVKAGDATLLVAGVTDYGGGDFYPGHKSDPALAVANAPASNARILLAHQPRSIKAAAALGFDLLLTGHTHGGQFFPWNFAAAAQQPYVSGLHNHNGTWIYVSVGTGYWGPPVRVGTRSEITVIRLVKDRALA